MKTRAQTKTQYREQFAMMAEQLSGLPKPFGQGDYAEWFVSSVVGWARADYHEGITSLCDKQLEHNGHARILCLALVYAPTYELHWYTPNEVERWITDGDELRYITADKTLCTGTDIPPHRQPVKIPASMLYTCPTSRI